MNRLTMNALSVFLGMSFLFIGWSVNADTASKVGQWFTQVNYSNYTAPGVYEGQKARYGTFGGFSARAPIRERINLLSVQTPKVSAGCGGIDLYMGGFEAINKDQLIESFRAIGENAQSLAFMLAIRIVTPQFAAQLENIQALADKYLNKSLNSCEAATKLVGGALNMFGASEGNCIVRRMNDFGEDWHTANLECGTGGRLRETENASDSPNEIAFVKGNIAWMALMEDPYFQNDIDFAELVMNITGTVIIRDAPGGASDAPRDIDVIEPSLGRDFTLERFENIYHVLLQGADSGDDLYFYRCSEERTQSPNGCTRFQNDMVPYSANWEGMNRRVERLINEIVNKIRNDTELTAEEIGLVVSSSFPLYKYLATAAARFNASIDISVMVRNYTEVVAQDILLNALKAVMGRMQHQAANVTGGLSHSIEVKAFRDDVESVIAGLDKKKEESKLNADALNEMYARMKEYEEQLVTKLGEGIMASATWGQ